LRTVEVNELLSQYVYFQAYLKSLTHLVQSCKEQDLDIRQLTGDSPECEAGLSVDLDLLVTCCQKMLYCLLYTNPALHCLHQIRNLSFLQQHLASIFFLCSEACN
jgi:hypothetical protein